MDVATNTLIAVNNNTATPSNRGQGRIVLAKPAIVPASDPNSAAENALYAGWLYALVATASDGLDGLYLTKDSGRNWTKVALNTAVGLTGNTPFGAAPSNDPGQTAFTYAGTNYNLAMSVDPSNPNVVYIGGRGNDALIRVDVTVMTDLYSLYQADNTSDGGADADRHDPCDSGGAEDRDGDPRGHQFHQPRRQPHDQCPEEAEQPGSRVHHPRR